MYSSLTSVTNSLSLIGNIEGISNISLQVVYHVDSACMAAGQEAGKPYTPDQHLQQGDLLKLEVCLTKTKFLGHYNIFCRAGN